MSKKYLRDNSTLFAIILFITIFSFIQFMKPSCFYNKNGSIIKFGIGYKNKTIFPIWLLSIMLAILCYLIVIYYNTYF